MGQFGGAEGRRGGAHKRSTVALNHLKILNEGCVADTPAGSLLGCGKEVIVLIRGWIAWATQRKGGRQKIGRDERNCPKKQHFLWRTLSPRSIGTAANCSSYFKWLYIKDLLTLTVRRSTKVTYMYCTIRGKLGGGGWIKYLCQARRGCFIPVDFVHMLNNDWRNGWFLSAVHICRQSRSLNKWNIFILHVSLLASCLCMRSHKIRRHESLQKIQMCNDNACRKPPQKKEKKNPDMQLEGLIRYWC